MPCPCVLGCVCLHGHLGKVCACVFVHMHILGLSVEISLFTWWWRYEPFSTHILWTSTRLPTKFCPSLHSQGQGNLLTSMQDEAGRFAQEIPSKQPGGQWIGITSKERLPSCWKLGLSEKLYIQLVPPKSLQKHSKDWQEKKSMWHRKRRKLLSLVMGMTIWRYALWSKIIRM